MVTSFSYKLAPQGPINGAMIDMGQFAGANLQPLPLPRKPPHLTLDQNMWRTGEASAGQKSPKVLPTT
jgi:hypothetical protein